MKLRFRSKIHLLIALLLTAQLSVAEHAAEHSTEPGHHLESMCSHGLFVDDNKFVTSSPALFYSYPAVLKRQRVSSTDYRARYKSLLPPATGPPTRS